MSSELTVTSSAFNNNASIPDKYTCKGTDISPPLSWTSVPEGTRSIAVICDDPDAPGGDWVHWVLFNLPPDVTGLPEGTNTDARLSNGAVQGITDFGSNGYRGPCPPPGRPHRYFFKVYALDTILSLDTGARKTDVEQAMQGHTLGEGKVIGLYQR